MSAHAKSPTRALVEQLLRLDYEDIPLNVINATKRTLMDTLMVARAGIQNSGIDELLTTGQFSGEGQSTVWGDGRKVSASSAALLNSVVASSLDFDTLTVSVHSDAVVVAATLAVAECTGASGREFLRALVIGNETICRLALSATGAQRGWSPTALYGGYGAAMAAACLLELDTNKTLDALGIVLSCGAGSQQATVERAFSRRIQPGFSTKNGVMAALSAQAGITGSHKVLEGKFGLWALYQPGDPASLVNNLGIEFMSLKTGFKKYPVCGGSHAAVAALERIRNEYNLTAEQIQKVDVLITPLAFRLVGTDMDSNLDPRIFAQYSLAYALAVVIRFGSLTLRHLNPKIVLDPKMLSFASRVTITQMSVALSDPLALAPARVKVTLITGAVVEQTIHHVPGSSELPLSDCELMQKYRSCAEVGSSPMRSLELEELANYISLLETAEDASSITQFLVN
ncbi:MmgE/PrpD family protein [Advenella kashmirensis]